MIGIILAVAPLSLAMLAMWITRWTPTWQFGIMMLSPPAALGTALSAAFLKKRSHAPRSWNGVARRRHLPEFGAPPAAGSLVLGPSETNIPEHDQPIVTPVSSPIPDPRKPVARRWRPSLGPLFYYDLVTATRRGQHSILRCTAATACCSRCSSAMRVTSAALTHCIHSPSCRTWTRVSRSNSPRGSCSPA